MSTRNIVGPIPEPEELYGREELVDYIWHQIGGCNILLLAPRRFGKSGVMRHVLLHPRDGYLPVPLELEDVTTPQEFVWRITSVLLSNDLLRTALAKARRLPTAIETWVKDTFDEVEFQGAKAKFKESVGEEWREAATRMLLEMENADPTIIFILDEFPSMIENLIKHDGAQAAEEFLAWFRTVRLEHKDKLRRHRFIVAGSVGIDTILRKLKCADKFNDFQRIYVEPIATPAACRLAGDLAEAYEITWNGQLEAELFSLLGVHVPYFIHLFFSQVGQLPAETRSKLTVADIQGIYESRVLGRTCKDYFEHYRGRLRRLGKPAEKAAIAILRAVSGSPQGRVSRSALFEVYSKAHGKGASDAGFDELLGDLEHDFYLVLDANTNEYHFLVKVMSDWWRRWYPPSKREGGKP